MLSATASAFLLASAAIAFWPDPPSPRWGLLRRATVDRRIWDLAPADRRALVIVAGLLGVATLFAPQQLLAAVPLAGVIGVASRRLPVKPDRSVVTADRAQLISYLDLLSACLDVGLPTATAIDSVLRASGTLPSTEEIDTAGSNTGVARGACLDPAGRALAEVAGLLMLGAEPARAWQPAASVPDLAAIAAAGRRSALGGIALAQALRDHAVVLRAALDSDLESKAGRAGVLMAAPLGLCFLPAFICLGLAPVVIALLADLGIGL
ncbi:type II secretion system protein [Nakamurella antarctica]|uniref:Type II secretion system protein n=1 Tax=Nakamurella antarctica TaxID=1902245 RepID=A0A3G8ZRM8_9ACTN|nr:type II secretion system F family protein [Nakamurella antarctica]AZI57154.1 type II secretion system protein [Nakamurella antarctica]